MNALLANASYQGISRIPATSKAEFFVALANEFSC